MKKWLKLALLLGLTASMLSIAEAQEADEGQNQGSRSMDEARVTGMGIRIRGSRGPSVVPEFYAVRRGDTLWDVTGRYYGNPWQWPRVWSYNPEVTNPHWIYPQERLRLRPGGPIVAHLPTADPGLSIRHAAHGTIWLREEGYLDAEALENSGEIVGSPEEQMLLSTFDEVYVRFENDAAARPGTDYTIFRRVRPEERRPGERGQLVRIMGTIRLRSYDAQRHIGRGLIREALDPIERGFRIAPVPRRFDVVAPVTNDRDLHGEVVASLRPLQLNAEQQIVFVDLGSDQGVRAGNRLFVVREGDQWRENLTSGLEYGQTVAGAGREDAEEYPPEIIAEGRAVDVRPHTTGLLITRSVREVDVGDRVEMRRGF
ncbi:MAG: LysM peptidoglycan-binding domain-containing protein [Deltaproteobacteria bacterium]|nr:LysM peptidoglycan-binding domain-containing protein [Deltaproteobacteria bacterium]